MLHKKIKQICSWMLAFTLLLGTAQFPSAGIKAAESGNVAGNATATALNRESDSLGPEKVIDGNLTERSSRWSSALGEGPSWIQLHWEDGPQTIENVVIYWERRNVENYRLEVSDDGQNWRDPIWSNSGYPEKNKDIITLDDPVTAQYLRLYIGKINSASANPSEESWQTASVYEIEVYEDEIPDNRTEAQKVADAISPPAEVRKGDGKISMPKDLPAGAKVRFCADYEQVIAEDGTIYAPLEEKTVKGFYEVTLADGSVAQTEEFAVLIPGQYTADDKLNLKPVVIPELQEWHGKTGIFAASSSGKIIVGNAGLSEVAQKLKEDYKEITGADIAVRQGTSSMAKEGDIYLSLTETKKGLDQEGYTIDVDEYVSVEAEAATGVYWATRTILQILKQSNGTIPKGFIRDYPKYEVRGFSLDVGRKPFTLEALYEFSENMSWYKLNSLQVHISDNLIFLEDYPDEETAIREAYAGFRLESTKRSQKTGKTATSEDVFYTKDDFRSFIQESRVRGVEIVPEFDMPAHALPFTRAFSEIMSTGGSAGSRYRIDELDLTQMDEAAEPDGESTMDIVKGIWNEYLEGDDPIFDQNTTIHVGTDEYHGVSGQTGIEYFRSFSDRMIEFVQDSGRTVRMWGSLSNKSGTTPVRAEGVQLNIWNTGYANPKDMYDMGFDLINTLEGPNYIVPAAGYYNDYINTGSIYNDWQPNVIGNLTMKAGDDQMLGGCYAIWHDSVDTRGNGISQYDSFDRFFKAAPVYGAKLWGDARDCNYKEFTQAAAKTGTAPGTSIYGELDYITSTVLNYTFDETLTKDSSANGFDLTKTVNAELADGSAAGKKSLSLKGGESYVETPGELDLIGLDAVLRMKVKRDADSGEEEQILCESKDAFGVYGTYAFKAVQKNTGKVGFSREGYDYSFQYELPKDDAWHELEFHSGQENVALYVDGELVDNKRYNEDGTLAETIDKKGNSHIISTNNNPDIYFANHPTTELSEKLAQEGIRKTATMLVPMGRIGSKTNSFKGQIESVTVGAVQEVETEGEAVSHDEMTVEACTFAADDVTPQKAVDGDEETFWHSAWNGTDKCFTESDHHTFTVTLKNPTVINALTYLPRQNSENGRIYEYGIEVTKADGTTEMVADHEMWGSNYDRKKAVFEPIEAKSVSLLIYNAGGDNNGIHGTIAELNLYRPIAFDGSKLDEMIRKYENYDKDAYTDSSFRMLASALETARRIRAYEGSSLEDYLYAYEQLEKAAANLETKPATKATELSEKIKDIEEQAKRTDLYSAEAIQALKTALEQAKAVLGNAEAATYENIVKQLDSLQNKLVSVKEAEMQQKRQELTAAISNANQALANPSAYTADSIAKLAEAVKRANEVLARGASLEELSQALLALKSVQPVQSGLSDNDAFEAGGMKYQVVSAALKTVKLVKGKDKPSVTVNTVSVNGAKYKVVEISARAFIGCKKKLKKVTLGPNVQVIGKNAFKNCKKLKTVIVQNKSKLKKVNAGAFKQTAKGISIKLPKNLKKNKNLKKKIRSAGIKKIK